MCIAWGTWPSSWIHSRCTADHSRPCFCVLLLFFCIVMHKRKLQWQLPQWIPSFCHACFPFSQPLNCILASFQVQWNQTVLSAASVVWHPLEGLKQGLCWARSLSSTWAQCFRATNKIIKGHANSAKAFPCIPGSGIGKKIEIISTLRDTPPASQPPHSCPCRAAGDADTMVHSWALGAFSVEMANAGVTAPNLRCRLSL